MSYGVVLPPGIVRIPSPSGGAASFATLTGVPADNAALTTALNLKLDKTGGTLTGQLINSTNGAASTPPVLLSGTIFAGNSAPALLIQPTGTTAFVGSTSGTLLGCNAPSGFAGSLLNLQRDGTKFWDFQAVGASESYPTLLCGTAAGGLSLKFNNPQLIFRRNDTWDFLSLSWTDVCAASTTKIGFNGSAANMSGGNGTCDAFFARSAAAHIKMGALHATTPTNQTFSAHNVTTGTGANLTVAGGAGAATPGSQITLGGGNGFAASASDITVKVSSGGALTTIASFTPTGVTLSDNMVISTGTVDGTIIAETTSQKLGFWATIPVVQPAHIADPTGDAGIGSDTVDINTLNATLGSIIQAITEINARDALIGITAAS